MQVYFCESPKKTAPPPRRSLPKLRRRQRFGPEQKGAAPRRARSRAPERVRRAPRRRAPTAPTRPPEIPPASTTTPQSSLTLHVGPGPAPGDRHTRSPRRRPGPTNKSPLALTTRARNPPTIAQTLGFQPAPAPSDTSIPRPTPRHTLRSHLAAPLRYRDPHRTRSRHEKPCPLQKHRQPARTGSAPIIVHTHDHTLHPHHRTR